MRARDLARVVGVVAVAVAVVLAATFAGGVVLSSPDGTAPAPSAPAYDTNELVVDPVSDDGTVSAPAGDESKTVVVDLSHGNAVSENDIQPFADALVAAGHDVRFYGGSSTSASVPARPGSAFNETLRGADALVVASPATAYSPSEIDGVEAFADAGGRVLLAADPPATGGTSTTISVPGLTTGTTASAAGQPANLAAAFELTFGSGYLYDMARNANNFQRVYAGETEGVADGVDRAVLLAATPLGTGPNATTVLSASDATLSTTRETDTYAVAARNGNVLAVGDTDLLTAGAATAGDNDVLVSNLAAFLVTGDKESGEPSNGETGGQGPTAPPNGGTASQGTTSS